jgi:hypothetical protein
MGKKDSLTDLAYQRIFGGALSRRLIKVINTWSV